MHGLRDLRVIDFTSGVAGGYATKLFADAGADVIKVEPVDGDPLRSWSATRGWLHGEDGALFQFLHTSKRSVVGVPHDPEILALLSGSDLVFESFGPGGDLPLELRRRFPGLVVLSISPWGRTGPYASRPATEFTIQAECGSISLRGSPDASPYMAAGRVVEFVGGTLAAVAALAAVREARRAGSGRHIDFSLLEAMNFATTGYTDLLYSLRGRPAIQGPERLLEVPSIEPTADGWVGFNTNTRQQFDDFLLLIERTDLLGDEELARADVRRARMAEWNEIVRAWTRRHTTAQIVERAALLRIPVAPVNDGKTVLDHEHFRTRGVFVTNPGGGFQQPRPAYRIGGQSLELRTPSPGLGQHTGAIEPRAPARRDASGPTDALPLAGLRVLDATAFWAGPSSTHMLAALGADVIHLESIQRPDGIRLTGGLLTSAEGWWEWGYMFLGANSNKRGLTLNLAKPAGVELAKRLIENCDALVENYSPRVMEQFGLDWNAVHRVNPRLVMVRMPAFGLDGPWRDHVGFAQTMEQITGMAWITGHRDDQPRIPRGPCDPLSGMHAAFGLLVALAERDASGVGRLVESPMVEGALNAAAEQILEYSAYGNLMARDGNRCPEAAPQGLYPCAGRERWLALSVATDEQWERLKMALDRPEWADDPAFDTLSGRRAGHDRIDAGLERWAAGKELPAAVSLLVSHGVPAGEVRDSRLVVEHPQLQARGYFEEVVHPVVGTHPVSTLPFRLEGVQHWIRAPAPLLGQHNAEILGGLLGLGPNELADLEKEGIIGTRPAGLQRSVANS